ncbi:beta strand repeat-containing protein, partial [Limnohabitans sp.]
MTTSPEVSAPAAMSSGTSMSTPTSVWSSNGWSWGSDAQSFKSMAMLGGGLLLLAGGGGGGGSSTTTQPPPPPVNLLSGTGIDGYIAHALVWRDLNGDGTWNSGEDYTFTDAKGDFSGLTGTGGTIRLTGLAPDLRAVLVDAPTQDTVDISTGQAFTGVLSAPDGAAVITPLTSLIAAALANNPDATAAEIAQAQSDVLKSLGIDPSAGVDLMNFDPLATAATTDTSTAAGQALMTATLEVQKAALQVANLLKVAQEAAGSAGVTDMAAVSAAVSASIASAVAGGQKLDFSSSALIGDALTAVQGVVLQEQGNTPEALLAVAVLKAQQATIQAAIVNVNQSLGTLIDNAVSNLNAPSGSVNIGSLFTDVAATQIVAQQNIAAQVSNSVLLAVQTGDTTSTGQVSVNVDQAIVAARSQVGTIFVPSASTVIALAVDNNGRSSYSTTQTSWSGITGSVLTNDLTPDGYQSRVDLIANGNEPGSGAQNITTGADVTLAGTYGTLVIASDGSFTYTVNASSQALVDLAPNQKLSESFTYRLAASNGTQSLSDLGTLTLVLDKTNLAPIVGVASISLLDPNTAGGTSINVVDLLSGAVDPESDPLTVQGLSTSQPIQGDFGVLAWDAGLGKWTYTIDPANPAVHVLKFGQTVRDIFTYSVTDGVNAGINTAAIIYIHGFNDAPILSTVSNATLTDTVANDTFANITGTLAATDPDGDPVTYVLAGSSATSGVVDFDVQKVSAYGTFLLNSATGAYKFAVNNAAVQTLKTTQTATFDVSATDGLLSSSTQTITVTLNGVNDAPVAVGYSNTIALNQSLTISTLVTGSRDAEGDSFSLTAATLRTGYTSAGTVSFNNGSVVFTPTSNFSGQVFIDYTLTDSGSASSQGQISLWVGSNTAPTAASKTLTTLEDTSLVLTTGDFGFADVDAGQSLSAVQITQLPAHGQLLLDGVAVTLNQTIDQSLIAAGKLSFVPVANANGAGYASVGFKVLDSGGLASSSSYTLTLDVTPVNHAPVIDAVNSATVAETAVNDVFSDITGTLTSTDPDGNTVSYQLASSIGTLQSGFMVEKSSTYGTFYLNTTTGAYKFVVDNAAVQALKSPQTISFDVNAFDGALPSTAKTLNITFDGVNDAPTLSTVSHATVTDTVANDIFADITGNLVGNDRDGDTVSFNLSGSSASQALGYDLEKTSAYGTFYLNTATGAYKFVVNDAAVEALKTTQTATFDVSTTDGTALSASQTITVTFNGVNDAPILSSVSNATVTDEVTNDTFADITGTLSVTDPENDTVSYTLSGSSVSIASGFSVEKTSAYGTFYLNTTTGAYKFVVNDVAVEALKSSATATFDVSATDGNAASTARTLTITFNGANDAPVLSTVSNATLTDTVANDTFANITGTLAATDPDGDPVTYVLAGSSATSGVVDFDVQKVSAYGTFLLNSATGAYKFAVNNAAVQTLKTTETATFDVSAFDGNAASTAQTITITLNGVNDAPVAVDYSNTIAINQSLTISTLVTGSSDPEGDSFSLTAATLRNGYIGAGSVSINNGSVEFTPTSNFSGQVYIDYTLTDSGQASSQGQISLWVGSNTAPTAASSTLSTREDTSLVLNTNDFGFTEEVDAGQTLSAVQITQLPAHGQLLLDGVAVTENQTIDQALIAAGKLSFVPAANANGPSYASLGFKVLDSGGLASIDSYTLTLDVTADNDAPTLNAVSNPTDTDTAANDIFEDITGTLAGFDVDQDTLHYVLTNSSPTTGMLDFDVQRVSDYGTFYLNTATGAYKFVVNDAAVEALKATATAVFGVSVSDGVASSASQNLTITFNGANDAPVLSTVSNATVTDTEDNNTFTDITGTLAGTDRDGDAVSYALSGGTSTSVSGFMLEKASTYGTFYLNTTTGAYKFVVNDAAVEALKTTQTATFDVSVTDGIASSAAQTITITLNGANDRPIYQADKLPDLSLNLGQSGS